jgi:hypothetical protein
MDGPSSGGNRWFRTGDVIWIVGAIVNDVSERETGIDAAPRSSTASSTIVWKPSAVRSAALSSVFEWNRNDCRFSIGLDPHRVRARPGGRVDRVAEVGDAAVDVVARPAQLVAVEERLAGVDGRLRDLERGPLVRARRQRGLLGAGGEPGGGEDQRRGGGAAAGDPAGNPSRPVGRGHRASGRPELRDGA